MEKSRYFFLQFKPVGSFCNLRCRYCYVRPWLAAQKVMSDEILECLMEKYLVHSPYPVISWHGGEPTLAGYDFFKKTMRVIKHYQKPNQFVRHLIQTNATLITPKLAKLFKEYNFEVSVSLDGPEDIHGINRVFPNGDNSFHETMKGIRIFQEHGITPQVICTVSKKTLPFATEVFNFFREQGFKRIKYSPVFNPKENKFTITNDDWFNYLKAVFYEWVNTYDPTIQIRELNEVIVWLLKRSLNLCSCDHTCLSWISIAPMGNIYPCEYLKERYYYGNILKIEFDDIFNTMAYQQFKKVWEFVPQKCQKCEFFDMCGNGCPEIRIGEDEKIFHYGIYAFCKERRELYYEIKKYFKSVLGGEIWKGEI